jgi:YbbR domain-containing protein
MDMTLTVPIEILNLPKQTVIYNQYRKETKVTLRGPRTIMQEMRSRSLSLPIDLSQVKPPDTVVISTDSLPLQLPGGVSVLRIQPASITLSIDELTEKDIPVQATTKGKLAFGYALQDITLSPENILVSGPRSLLDQQETLKTVPIDLAGKIKTETLPVSLALSSELMDLIGETTVAAKIIIQEKLVEKIVYDIPIHVMDKDTKLSVTLKPDTVSVFASLPEWRAADGQDLTQLFKASVQVGKHSLPCTLSVEVSGHESILIKSYTPQEVEALPGQSKTKTEAAAERTGETAP